MVFMSHIFFMKYINRGKYSYLGFGCDTQPLLLTENITPSMQSIWSQIRPHTVCELTCSVAGISTLRIFITAFIAVSSTRYCKTELSGTNGTQTWSNIAWKSTTKHFVQVVLLTHSSLVAELTTKGSRNWKLGSGSQRACPPFPVGLNF